MSPKKPSPPRRIGWRPRRPEVPEQCASCPFRTGNDAEWRAVVEKLRARLGLEGPATATILRAGRYQVAQDVLGGSGEFACHHTVYDARMDLRDPREHRQCPGASRLYRGDPP